ncbi:unnamed protein product [Absidia cylindrospora]
MLYRPFTLLKIDGRTRSLAKPFFRNGWTSPPPPANITHLWMEHDGTKLGIGRRSSLRTGQGMWSPPLDQAQAHFILDSKRPKHQPMTQLSIHYNNSTIRQPIVTAVPPMNQIKMSSRDMTPSLQR